MRWNDAGRVWENWGYLMEGEDDNKSESECLNISWGVTIRDDSL